MESDFESSSVSFDCAPELEEHPGYSPLEIPSILESCTCPVCKEVYLDPTMPSCGHLHCRACLLSLPEKNCTLCNQSFDEANLRDLSALEHRTLRKILAGVQVRCNACQQYVARGLKGEYFEAHIAACLYQCPECSIMVERALIPKHYLICPNVRRKCCGCHFVDRQSVVLEHEASCLYAQTEPLKKQIDQLTQRLAQIEDSQQCKRSIEKLSQRIGRTSQTAGQAKEASWRQHIRLSEMEDRMSKLEGESGQLLGLSLLTRLIALEKDRNGQKLFVSPLPLAQVDHPMAGHGHETKDLHIKSKLKVEGNDVMLNLVFEGHHYLLQQPIFFQAVAYVTNNSILNTGMFQYGGCKVGVKKFYTSTDGFVCLVVSAGGADWHASDLSMRLIGNFSDTWRQSVPELFVVDQIEHREGDF